MVNRLFDQDEGSKLVWRTGYFVDWADDAKRETGYGTVPAYIIGKNKILEYLDVKQND